MRQLGTKNIITDLQSNRKKWDDEDMAVPQPIRYSLEDLKMDKPSIIQAAAIPKINASPGENFLFQAINGSGKTLSFAIPAIMRVDPSIDATQVLIIANTRELIRQVQQFIAKICERTTITSCIGETSTPEKVSTHIIVTVPDWVRNRVESRTPINL